jgi:carbonic anhydrase/acetyltransferase-like protein (isoleucine patch superfamily)
MLAGVTIVDPQSTWIDADTVLEPDAVIHPFTVIRGASRVASGAEVGPHAVLVDAVVGEHAFVGPFCYLRPGTVLEAGAKAGTFVEIKNSVIGEGTKVPHLTYLGDADVGADTNIAAGNITANQEHTRVKERTVSGATSGRESTIRSSPRSRSATTHGLQPAPSSQRMSPQGRSRLPARSRSTRKDAVESGTIEQSLPGLESMTPQPDLEVGRAIALAPQKRLMLFSGRSNPELAHRIAEQLGIELGSVKLKTFPNGETYCRYEESVAARTCSSSRPPASRSTGTCRAADHDPWRSLASAKRITALSQFLRARTSPARVSPSAHVSSRTCCRPPAPTASSPWICAGQVRGFIHIPVDHMTAVPMFAQYVRDLNLKDQIAVVSPDTGRTKLAGSSPR